MLPILNSSPCYAYRYTLKINIFMAMINQIQTYEYHVYKISKILFTFLFAYFTEACVARLDEVGIVFSI